MIDDACKLQHIFAEVSQVDVAMAKPLNFGSVNFRDRFTRTINIVGTVHACIDSPAEAVALRVPPVVIDAHAHHGHIC